MLKICRRMVILVLLLETVYFVQARPPLKRPNRPTYKGNERVNNSSVTFIRRTSPNNVSRADNLNRTKTRILFRGQFLEDFSEQDIIFPDTYQVIFENIPRLDGPPKCAKGSTFCEEVDSYPYYHVEDVLKRKQVSNNLFGKDEPPIVDLNSRNTGTETYMCASIQKTIFPKIGKNKNNKWKYIINQGESEGYIQGIRIEVCKQEGPCNLIGGLPDGYVTSCKQKFMLRRLMSLSDSGDPVQDTFQLPSACCCTYRKDFSFLSRANYPDNLGRIRGQE